MFRSAECRLFVHLLHLGVGWIALLSAVLVLVQIGMGSLNHFYFAPHQAYPYPYPTEWVPEWLCADIAA